MAPDEELIGRVADGDEMALTLLMRRYERPVSSFLYRHTGGRDVEDLYQETWLRVVRHAPRFDRQRKFSTWLFQIAVNLCRDWHRRNARPQAETAAAPGHDLSAGERRIDAATLLARLPEPQREVVLLRYYEDMSEEEVARVLGCPKGTVKSRLHNAIQRLASLVREEPQ